MTKDEYLRSTHVMEFAQYLQSLAGGRRINCTYTPKKDKNNPFNAHTLEEALMNYQWNKLNYSANKRILDSLSERIKSAMHKRNSCGVLLSALEVLVWGEVYKGSAGWIAKAARQGELLQKIRLAIDYFDGDTDNRSDMFENNVDLRSDSGTTKIFSLAAKRSIIYDDRVACALGMLVVDYLDSKNVAGVPEELNFLMGVGKRNPGNKKHRFEYKRQGVDTGTLHAYSNLRANWIVQKVVESDDFQWMIEGNELSKVSDKMRAFEAALFMIGYKAFKDEYNDRGYYLVTP